MTASGFLSHDDVARLMSEPSPDTRRETALKIAQGFDTGQLTESERKLAIDIFRLMVRDAEVRVRSALAMSLKSSREVPRDVALALARDVESVAIPMLQYSEVLNDADLIEIVKSQGSGHQVAIASRAKVSESVSDALVESGSEKAVETLVGNEGAAISETSLGKVVDRFPESEGVQTKLVGRTNLPITVAERLVTKVSEHLRQQLLSRRDLPETMVGDLSLVVRERAILGLAGESTSADLEALVRQLHKNGRLTPSILLRAVCMGDMHFLEAGLAQITGVPIVNARILIHDAGPMGFKAIYGRAKLPQELYPAFRAAIDVEKETLLDGEARDRERHARRMIERILTQYGDLGVKIDGDDLDYLLTRMRGLPSSLTVS
ncbi:MAG: DUF2336 domain-containing protein [Rhodospirillales bacterium]|nr:DUF2336 domain-containing protein [Rhodospirillales bacterium]